MITLQGQDFDVQFLGWIHKMMMMERGISSLGFIAVKRHHDHDNSYKGKPSVWGCLTVQKFSRCHHARRRSGPGEGAESSISRLASSRKRDTP